jgi:glycogen operon protein
MDTARAEPVLAGESASAGSHFPLKPHSLAVLKRRRAPRGA